MEQKIKNSSHPLDRLVAAKNINARGLSNPPRLRANHEIPLATGNDEIPLAGGIAEILLAARIILQISFSRWQDVSGQSSHFIRAVVGLNSR